MNHENLLRYCECREQTARNLRAGCGYRFSLCDGGGKVYAAPPASPRRDHCRAGDGGGSRGLATGAQPDVVIRSVEKALLNHAGNQRFYSFPIILVRLSQIGRQQSLLRGQFED